MKRRRYQYGSLTKKSNRLSEDVWQFRFYETTPEGRRYRRSTTIGTVAQYPTKTHALRIIEPLRLRLNLHHRFGRPISLGALIDHYVERELPERRHSTQQSHSSTLKRWILPRWGDRPLEEVKPVAVEEWLRSLTLAPKTKVNLRSLFHLIYEHARRWELTDRNPIDLVRQRGGRRCIPRVLTPGEIRLLLAQLAEPYHTMVMVAACLGLRASEIVGLQWQDLNWEDLTVFIRRGVVNGRSGHTKTEASQKSLPIDPRLARSPQELWKRSLHKSPQDWVFANNGGRPRGQQNILQRHTFRHSYSTMLRGAGADIKVQQELLRHSTIQSTMNTYTQAVSEQKRAANTIVVGILFNENASTDQPSANGS
jgi:integrase